jgi:hypothetical protein
MVLKEFLTDLKVATDFFSETNFDDLINECVAIAEQAKAGSLENWRESLEKQIEQIDEVTLNFEVNNAVVLIENTYLNESANGFITYSYRSVLNGIFSDIINADTELRALVEDIRSLKTHSSQIRSALDAVGIVPPEPEENDANLAAFEFKQTSNIGNLKELYGTARHLHMHLRSIAKLDLDTPVGDIEIAVLSKSSPFSLKAYISKKMADALNKILGGILDNLKKMQELRSMEESIRQQKLDTRSKKLELALKTRRAEMEIEVIGHITKQLMRRFPDESRNGTRSEVQTGVEKAVEYFITQTNNGLEIRVIPSKSEIQSDTSGESAVRHYQEKLIEADKIIKQIPDTVINEEEAGEAEATTEDIEQADTNEEND